MKYITVARAAKLLKRESRGVYELCKRSSIPCLLEYDESGKKKYKIPIIPFSECLKTEMEALQQRHQDLSVAYRHLQEYSND